MDKTILIEFFKTNTSMSPDTIKLVISDFEERQLIKDEFILKQGKICDYTYLLKGIMRSYTYDNEGNEVTTNFFTPNRAVYDPASFFTQKASKENIQAITDCLAFSIPFQKVNALFHNVPEFREFGRSLLVNEFVMTKERNLSMINNTAEQRYEELINQEKDIFKYAQLKHIASYLGITNSSLSRIRKQFTKH